MAQRLETYDWTKNRGYSRYDWDALADGNIWELREGEDFTCTRKGLRDFVARQAKKRGMGLRFDYSGEHVVLQFYRQEEGQ